MKLIAQKPCSFGGKKFCIGDEIPSGYVLDPKAQEKMGVLVIAADGEAPVKSDTVELKTVEAMTVLIHAEEGDMPLNITAEGLQAVANILTSNLDVAEPIVAKMTDGDALILLHMTDNRRTIKTAAEERAKVLSEESEGEQ